MVLHARSDIQGAIIPVASGGCGELHSRPVKDGAPAKAVAARLPPVRNRPQRRLAVGGYRHRHS